MAEKIHLYGAKVLTRAIVQLPSHATALIRLAPAESRPDNTAQCLMRALKLQRALLDARFEFVPSLPFAFASDLDRPARQNLFGNLDRVDQKAFYPGHLHREWADRCSRGRLPRRASRPRLKVALSSLPMKGMPVV